MVESSGLRNLLEECCDDKSKIDRLRCNFEVHDNQKQVRTNCKIKCKNGHEKRLRPLLFNKNGYYWNQTRPDALSDLTQARQPSVTHYTPQTLESQTTQPSPTETPSPNILLLVSAPILLIVVLIAVILILRIFWNRRQRRNERFEDSGENVLFRQEGETTRSFSNFRRFN